MAAQDIFHQIGLGLKTGAVVSALLTLIFLVGVYIAEIIFSVKFF